MSFAFGLAVFGSALTVGLRAYLAAAASEQRDILDRITLESATHNVLGRLAAGEVHSIKPTTLAEITLNQRRVTIQLSLPEGKYDYNDATDRAPMLKALREDILAGQARSSLPSIVGSVVELSHAWRLSATEEDCLRRLVTMGRAPEVYHPEAAAGEGEGLVRIATAGDQVDIRVSLSSAGSSRALWSRARFAGAADRPWRLHDYRLLRLAESEAAAAGQRCLMAGRIPLAEAVDDSTQWNRSKLDHGSSPQ